ncbi:MAG: hypothetical protein QM398_01580 [Thermoproteota archaeon]|nr:hypothetical protein [Thermoproteota archaeon]
MSELGQLLKDAFDEVKTSYLYPNGYGRYDETPNIPKLRKDLLLTSIRVFREWLAGKLVAGSEKATPYNDVILKLLAEIKDGANKQ